MSAKSKQRLSHYFNLGANVLLFSRKKKKCTTFLLPKKISIFANTRKNHKTDLNTMGGSIKETTVIQIVIHAFAFFHAISSYIMQTLGHADEVILTALTISMVILIATRYDFPLEVTFALALLNCFAGFYLGTVGAHFIEGIMHVDAIYSNVITTFLMTEFLGWMTFLIVRSKSGKTR